MGNLPRWDKTCEATDEWWRAQRQTENRAVPSIYISELGDMCDRRIWLKSRNHPKLELDGRKIRLNDGIKIQKARFTIALRGIGYKIWDEQKQVIALDGALTGHIDGIVLGVLEAPKREHLLKYELHKDKSFRELKNYGVKRAHFEHFIQVQIYMGLLGLKRCLYLAINKNTDEISQERIKFDSEFFKAQMRRAERIKGAGVTPVKISESPKWWRCKACFFWDGCHGGE